MKAKLLAYKSLAIEIVSITFCFSFYENAAARRRKGKITNAANKDVEAFKNFFSASLVACCLLVKNLILLQSVQ